MMDTCVALIPRRPGLLADLVCGVKASKIGARGEPLCGTHKRQEDRILALSDVVSSDDVTTKEPDKRWKHRFDKALDALENAEACLLALVELDSGHRDAIWQDDARQAVGCVSGARELLISGNDARDKHLAAHPRT